MNLPFSSKTVLQLDRDGSGVDLIVSVITCLRKHLVLSYNVTGMASHKP